MRWNLSATDLFVRCRCSCARLRPHPYTHTRAYRHSNTSTHSHTLLWPPELNSNLRFWALPVGWGYDVDGGDGGNGDGDSAVRETAGCLNSPKVNVWSFFFAFFPLTRFSSFHLNNKRLFFCPNVIFFRPLWFMAKNFQPGMASATFLPATKHNELPKLRDSSLSLLRSTLSQGRS